MKVFACKSSTRKFQCGSNMKHQRKKILLLVFLLVAICWLLVAVSRLLVCWFALSVFGRFSQSREYERLDESPTPTLQDPESPWSLKHQDMLVKS